MRHELRHLSWFVFSISLTHSLTDASTQDETTPESTTMKGDATTTTGGNDEEEGERDQRSGGRG